MGAWSRWSTFYHSTCGVGMSRYLLAIGVALTMVLGVGPAAEASPRAAAPAVSMSFVDASVNQRAASQVRYASAQLPRGSVLYLQRKFGTAQVYRNVKRLSGRSGRTTVPGVAMGRYFFRVVAMVGTRRTAASTQKALYVYGNLSLTQICSRSQDTSFSSCSTGTVPVGTNVFAYAAYSGGYHSGPTSTPDVTAQNSSCRSVTLRFALKSYQGAYAQTAGVALSQAAADQQTATGPIGAVSSATFGIQSSVWNLTFWNEPESGESVYWDATFNCWSTTGDR